MMGLPIVPSPMAGNLEDLHEFSKRVILAKPWQYDHTVRSFLSLRVSLLKTSTSVFLYLGKPSVFETRVVNWGVIWEDGNEQISLFCC
jgi:hypothetical protein